MSKKVKIRQTIRVRRGDQVIHEEEGEGDAPETREVDPSHIEDMSKLTSVRADSCIYCGSKEGLTREHAVPYALQGSLVILNGSCESCQNKTKRFEGHVLAGPLRMVRYIQGLRSRRKHKDVSKTVRVTATTKDGAQTEIDIPRDEAPILVTFSEFGDPKYLDPNLPANLTSGAAVTGSYGKDPAEVAKNLAADGLQIVLPPTSPTAFAQMIAKIAYCFAFAQGHLERIENVNELVHAFMNEPDTLGRFVGSKPPPFEKYKGVSIRIAIKVKQPERIAYAEVQPFAASGAPTYLVVLGRVKLGEELRPQRQQIDDSKARDA